MGWRDIRDGNPVKEALRDGRAVVGCFIRSPSVEMVEVCAHAGCEFVLIDLEHSATSWDGVSAMIIGAEAAGTTPLVRVSNPSRDLVSRVLDIGAHGVMVARVDSAETTAAVVAATRYGPGMTRGVAGGRGSGWGLRMPMDQFQAAANRATFVSVQVETRLAVERIEEIAAVDGLDCVFVGTSDLTTDLGVPGSYDDHSVAQALDRVHQHCDGAGVAVGYPAGTLPDAEGYLERGARLIACSDTGILAQAMSAFTREVKAFVD